LPYAAVYDPAALATDLFTDFHHGLLRREADGSYASRLFPLCDIPANSRQPGH
jgi:hypothetical protein